MPLTENSQRRTQNSAQAARYRILPYVKTDTGWSLPDELLLAVWRQLVDENKVQTLFYDGAITDPIEWIGWVRNPENHFAFVWIDQEKRLGALGWINSVADRHALTHFAVLGPYRRGIIEAIVRYWSGWKVASGEPLFRVLMGITPETYTAALKVAKHCGYTIVGTVPELCHLAYEERRVGGTISYYRPGTHLSEEHPRAIAAGGARCPG